MSFVRGGKREKGERERNIEIGQNRGGEAQGKGAVLAQRSVVVCKGHN